MPNRAGIALIDRESSDDYNHDGVVGDAFVTVYQQRCQQEIMDKEQQEEQHESAPDEKHFCPVEQEIDVVHHPHIQAQQWSEKKQAPHC